ncbi:alpha/beta hydrolase [Oricola sp.]|uniref:alpha/beta hydrolase n=1 Tax=Oricola sp. TaxID=1979950 RepID=UPI0025D70DEB|nr:alpha/beta hydrolase [Oricola sp.]MCI5077857.1 alpha/beta hydrolase [Oricola sp.]
MPTSPADPIGDPLAPLRPLGTELTPDLVRGTYAFVTPLAVRLDTDTTEARYDIAYGVHPRHRLDVYRPAGAAVETVVVYVHGGGFSSGDKGGEGQTFFGNVGAWAARCGFAAVAMNYRLAPEAQWPAVSEDIRDAVRHLSGNTAELFGAKPRIVLIGQSAGAVAVGQYLAGQVGPVDPAVAGAVLMSGIHDFVRHEHGPFEDAYFGTDPARFADHSALFALARLDLPIMFTLSELDSPRFHRQAAFIVEAWMEAKGHWPALHYLPGHNHISPAPLIGSPIDTVGPMIERFVAAL